MPFVYCSGPIDHAADGQNWIDALQHVASQITWPSHGAPMFYFPARALHSPSIVALSEGAARKSILVNTLALLTSDAMILRYCPGVETWGCPIEVYHAAQNATPVYLITSSEDGLRRITSTLYLNAYVPINQRFTDWHALLSRICLDLCVRPNVNASWSSQKEIAHD